jgi:hypothetical protein
MLELIDTCRAFAIPFHSISLNLDRQNPQDRGSKNPNNLPDDVPSITSNISL